MSRRSIQDRLSEATSAIDVLVHEARVDVERKRIELERAMAVLVDVENAARRTASYAVASRRPRHLMAGERQPVAATGGGGSDSLDS